MNAAEKQLFIAMLCNRVRDSIIAKIERMPEEWDGHELRRLIADTFEHEAWTVRKGSRDPAYRRRYRKYVNIRGVENLV